MRQNASTAAAQPWTPLKELTALPNKDVFKEEGLIGSNPPPKNVGNLLPQDAF